MHHLRWWKRGDPGGAQRERSEHGCITPDGYRRITVDGSPTPEHRVVMEHMLDRPLERWENVRHINGIRDDNRPANLELWVKPQPAGQRAADLAEWVVDHYPELVAAAQDKRAQLRIVG